jgi:hypothetical protein
MRRRSITAGREAELVDHFAPARFEEPWRGATEVFFVADGALDDALDLSLPSGNATMPSSSMARRFRCGAASATGAGRVDVEVFEERPTGA